MGGGETSARHTSRSRLHPCPRTLPRTHARAPHPTRPHPHTTNTATQVLTKFCCFGDSMRRARDAAFVRRGVGASASRLGLPSLDLIQFYWHDYNDRGYVQAAQNLAKLQVGCLLGWLVAWVVGLRLLVALRWLVTWLAGGAGRRAHACWGVGGAQCAGVRGRTRAHSRTHPCTCPAPRAGGGAGAARGRDQL